MSIDWSAILPPEQMLRHQRIRGEVDRLFGLPDRWLAEELLRLARRMRHDFPAELGNPHANSYSPALVWHLVPEIARRLGATRLQPNEATHADISGLTDAELRQAVAVFLQHGSPGRWLQIQEADRPSAGDILGHDLANGNPIAIAMDRLAPPPEPGDIGEDWLARHIHDISIRRGHQPATGWHPGLQRQAEPAPAAAAAEPPPGPCP